MITAWYKHLSDPEQIDHFKRTVISAGAVLERQNAILDEMEADVNRQEVNPTVYDKPNWDYRQADNNGYRRAIKHIRHLITLHDEDFQPRPMERTI